MIYIKYQILVRDNKEDKLLLRAGEHSIRGSRGLPKLKPIIFRASLIGIGLVSAKSASTNGKDCN